jgi:hypothetical protein
MLKCFKYAVYLNFVSMQLETVKKLKFPLLNYQLLIIRLRKKGKYRYVILLWSTLYLVVLEYSAMLDRCEVPNYLVVPEYSAGLARC